MRKALTYEPKTIKDINLYLYLQEWLKEEGKIYSKTKLKIIIDLFKSATYIDQETFKLNRENKEETEKCRAYSKDIQSKLNYFLVEFLYYISPVEIIPEVSLKWEYDDEDFWYKSSIEGDEKALNKIKTLMNSIYNQLHISENMLTLIAPFIIKIFLLKQNIIRNCDNLSSYDKEFFKIVFGKKIEDYKLDTLENSFPRIAERYIKAPFLSIMKFLCFLDYTYIYNRIRKEYSDLENIDCNKLEASIIYKYYLVIFLRNKATKYPKQIIIAAYILSIAYVQVKSLGLNKSKERIIPVFYSVYEKIDASVLYSNYNDILHTFGVLNTYEYGFKDNVLCKIAFRELSSEHQEIVIQGIKELYEFTSNNYDKSVSHIKNILLQDFLNIS